VLKTLAEQVVIALNNAGLRRLVRNLSVTDEKSGLLKRASYLDLALAEAQRATQQATPFTILLMHFGRSAALDQGVWRAGGGSHHGAGGPAVLRRTSARTIWRFATTPPRWRLFLEIPPKKVVAGGRETAQAGGDVKMPGRISPFHFSAGLAEAVMRSSYDRSTSSPK